MSRLDDELHPDVYVFVEDREARTLLREILASDQTAAGLLQRIEINPVGPAHVVEILGGLGAAGRLPYKSLAVLDGDYSNPNCYSLPGTEAPEKVVYGDLKRLGWPNIAQRFGIGAGVLITALEDAMLDTDHHRWNELVGNQINKGSGSVWEILASEWCKSCLNPADRVSLMGALTSIADAPR